MNLKDYTIKSVIFSMKNSFRKSQQLWCNLTKQLQHISSAAPHVAHEPPNWRKIERDNS